MVVFASNAAALRRVQCRSGERDRLRLRQRLERTLAAVDWTPPDLTPGAILLVRRLAPAVPTRAGAHLTFADRVSAELRRQAGRARRPWLHADAADAEAVVFADEAELIACLVRDWLRGLVRDRWWWPSVLNGAGVEQWMRQYVLPRGEVLVPAISLLERDGEAVRFIARLTAFDVSVAVAAVARAFAVPAVAALRIGNATRAERAGTDAAAPADAGVVTTRARAALGRLIATVPEIRSPALDAEQRRLAVVVLAVARSIAWTRTSEFEDAMTVLAAARFDLDAVASILPTVLGFDRSPQPAVREQMLSTSRAVAAATEAAPRERVAEMVDAASAPSTLAAGAEIAARRTSRRRTEKIALSPADSSVADRPRAAGNARARRAQPREVPAAAVEDSTPRNGAEWRTASSRAEEASWPTVATSRVETDYGGIFYLLNAWLAMGLYSDFTAPRGPNLPLSPWDLLALVGRAWFGDPFVADRVWTLLADLAVRNPDAEPGRDVDLPSEWLAEHLETLGRRLEEALGSEPASEIPALVCCHHASIDVTAGSLHVHLSLGELPLALRIAGLDRDPGWIPAAGRAVAFHFA